MRLVTRNYRCRLGELDLVMTQHRLLIVVEVRSRHNQQFGTGLESVTHAKQRRITQGTRHFLMRHPRFTQWPCRFDVVSVSRRNYRTNLEWMQNAF